jgi:hypothetical protein
MMRDPAFEQRTAFNVIAGPARQKLNRMTQLEPITSGEIGAELSDDLAFKSGALSRLSRMMILAGLVRSQIH